MTQPPIAPKIAPRKAWSKVGLHFGGAMGEPFYMSKVLMI